MIFAVYLLLKALTINGEDTMKNIVVILLTFVVLSCAVTGREGRRAEKKVREEATAAMITRMTDERNIRFLAQIAHPLGGGSIHLTSEYTLDIAGDSIMAWLPYYGVAYTADYGGTDGGIKFSETANLIDVKKDRKGYTIQMEVKAPNDLYRLNLQITTAGYATLNVSSHNRQSISFSGIVEDLKQSELR